MSNNRKPRTPPPIVEPDGDFEFPEAESEAPVRQPRSEPRPDLLDVPKTASPGIPKRAMISMDDRKLSKKQREQLTKTWRGANRGRNLDAYMQAQLEEGQKKWGDSRVIAANDSNNVLIGIKTPSLAFEYLICQDVFPLGLVMQVNGPPNSLKSSLGFEFMRWIRLAGGGSHLFEVESKFDSEWCRTIAGHGKDEHNVIVDKCDSVEEWQTRLQYRINLHQKNMQGTDKEPGPGRRFPVGFFVDTIVGKNSYETQEKTHKEGFAGRNHPVEALSITSFMKTVPQMIDEWPFALVLLNHLKFGKDDGGRDVRRTAGGVGVNFQESWELETSVRRSSISCQSWDGRVIQIKCAKNSFGPTGRSIDARLLFWDQINEETGLNERQAMWDWNWATVKMLTDPDSKAAAMLKKADFHIKAETTGDATATAWSAALGMKAKDAVPWDEIGDMISKNEQAKQTIRQALGIKPRPILAGDYLEMIESMREKAV
jgi:hypothetical protein